jgi:hypothetical protein
MNTTKCTAAVWVLLLTVLTGSATAADDAVIYSADFDDAIGAEWSDIRQLTTPSGRAFLGEYGNDTVTLTLNGLLLHTNLVVSFDLVILKSWDGNGLGPDIWDLRLAGADVPLVRTTISQNRNNGLQQFPNGVGQGSPSFLARTGASELDSLGYPATRRDSIYHIAVSFPHAADSVSLSFSATNLQGIADESWAIDNFVLGQGSLPIVSLKNLVNDLPFIAPATISVEADVRGSEITHVDFLTNGVLVASLSQGPYTIKLANVPAGIIPITARAFNAAGLYGDAVAAVIVNGLSAEYYGTDSFGGTNISRVDPVVNFSWDAQKPIPGVGNTFYSVRWTGYMIPEFSEPYTISTSTDDGVRLWLDGTRVIDDWTSHSEKANGITLSLVGGHRYRVQMDYVNYQGSGARAKLFWLSPSVPKQIIPQSNLEPFLTPTNHPPNKPKFITPNNIGNPVDTNDTLVLKADFFSDPDRADTHEATDWEIWTIHPFQRVWASLGATLDRRLATTLRSGIFENSHAGRTNLVPYMTYLLRVRHQDSSGNLQTAWGDYGELQFDTIPRFMVAENTFDSGTEGWTTWDEHPPYNAVAFTDTDGNLGGAAKFTEASIDGAVSYWSAPAEYLGLKTAVYGGVLAFDLRQEIIDNQFDAPDVVLEGGGMILVYDNPNNPGPNWTPYKVPLKDQARWRVGTLEGPNVTRDQMQTVLGDLTKLLIRGEFNGSIGEINYLDNVSVTAPVAPSSIGLAATNRENRRIELSWPAIGADFVLEQRDLIESGDWQPVQQPRVYDSTVSVVIETSSNTAFFRLRRQ